jgi:hypothetical protein
MASAAVLGAVNFVVGYQTVSSWKTFRSKVRVVRVNLLLLLILEACAGFVATSTSGCRLSTHPFATTS